MMFDTALDVDMGGIKAVTAIVAGIARTAKDTLSVST